MHGSWTACKRVTDVGIRTDLDTASVINHKFPKAVGKKPNPKRFATQRECAIKNVCCLFPLKNSHQGQNSRRPLKKVPSLTFMRAKRDRNRYRSKRSLISSCTCVFSMRNLTTWPWTLFFISHGKKLWLFHIFLDPVKWRNLLNHF